jgi:hypothetical protein
MGTASKPELSNGNTYPTIGVPWGMNYWTPQTGKMGNGWAYTYDADKIRGFKQTHQPSPWMNDYGQFAVMPVTGAKRFTRTTAPAGSRTRPKWPSPTTTASTWPTATSPPRSRRPNAPPSSASPSRRPRGLGGAGRLRQGLLHQGDPGRAQDRRLQTRYARGPLPKNFRNWFVI